ncbi:MAG: TonB-dependent receptor family protein [Bacteroidia bacterium]|nr:TonB-dependent receptor [Bacteroidia bacterium]MCZ2277995.1 TonB-dependent receptor family protein [Bacteroidia bacterium]
MKRFKLTTLLFLFFTFYASAQFPGTHNQQKNGKIPAGKFYGKIIDGKTNKGIEFAAVQLMKFSFDSVTKTHKESLVGGQLTKANGDFVIENVPVTGDYILKASAIGYKMEELKVSFGVRPGHEIQAGAKEKDLGNIKLGELKFSLGEVVIDGSPPPLELKPDKKVYTVDKDVVAAGGTAEDVLKNVPSVNVDIDGNVTVRNAAPQLFVDGRPSTLTIDQIPADAIQEIEIITNPSAKYDASGGEAGILNIVLKKERKIGYNGTIRAGIDSRGRINSGFDLNLREGKVNWFISGSLNQRLSRSSGEVERFNLRSLPLTQLFQTSASESKGAFKRFRSGFDFFLTNRSTLSLTGYYSSGGHKGNEELLTQIDTVLDSFTTSAFNNRLTSTKRNMRFYGGTVSFKHLFPKEGRELTADANYNASRFQWNAYYNTNYYTAAGIAYAPDLLQKRLNKGDNGYYTLQLDYTDKLNEDIKLETGIRGALRNYESLDNNFVFNTSLDEYVFLPLQSNNYRFLDQVYAGYAVMSHQVNSKFSYQAGLRVESSFYEGELIQKNQKFENTFPFSLFPSGAISYKLDEKDNLQASYSRRINRPSFFRLIPFTDYSDSLNLSRGNPELKPEFSNSVELSFQRSFNRRSSFLATVYWRNTNGLMSNYVVSEFDTFFQRDVLISTYVNASSSDAYGVELTLQYAFTSWFDASANVNFYQSVINSTNVESNLKSERFSWTGKTTLNFKLPESISIQLTGDYQSRMSLVQGGGFQWGWMGSPQSTVQGYINPSYSLDAAVKYSFLKDDAASLSVSVSDIFKTRTNDTYNQTDFYIQNSIRKRDAQIIRINFSYRFGKFDTSIFRRKNNQNQMQDMDMGM